MKLYEKVQDYLFSQGWEIQEQYRKDGELMKKAPLYMVYIDAKNKDAMLVSITKGNKTTPSIVRATKDGMKNTYFESMHIREFLEKGVDEVFKVRQTKRVK